MLAARLRRQSPLVAALALAGCVPRAVPPPHPVATAPTTTLRQVMLAVHARARAQVGLPPLVWSDALAAEAWRWAAALARSGGFEHADQEDEGENLWMGTRGAYSYAEMAGHWVSERRFAGRARFEDAGHYTQIVWRGTRRIGCAIASNARDDVLVCRYDPPGNAEGEQAY